MIEPAVPPENPEATVHAARIERQDDAAVLALHPDAPFEAVRQAVRELLSDDGEHADLQGRAVRVDMAARGIQLFDLRRLVTLLKDEFQVVVSGLRCTDASLVQYAEKQLRMRIFVEETSDEAPCAAPDAVDDCLSAASPLVEVAAPGLDDPPAPPVEVELPVEEPAEEAAAEDERAGDTPATAELEPVVAAPAEEQPTASLPEGSRRTLSVHKTLRSGVSVRFPGDIVIFGDVNPGAEVVADGNVVVLGSLRGMAHAGARGDTSATVMAFTMLPTNLRIAEHQADLSDLSAGERDGGLLARLRAPGLFDRGGRPGLAPREARLDGKTVTFEAYAGRPAASRSTSKPASPRRSPKPASRAPHGDRP